MLAGHVGQVREHLCLPPRGNGYMVVDRCAGRPHLAEGSPKEPTSYLHAAAP